MEKRTAKIIHDNVGLIQDRKLFTLLSKIPARDIAEVCEMFLSMGANPFDGEIITLQDVYDNMSMLTSEFHFKTAYNVSIKLEDDADWYQAVVDVLYNRVSNRVNIDIIDTQHIQADGGHQAGDDPDPFRIVIQLSAAEKEAAAGIAPLHGAVWIVPAVDHPERIARSGFQPVRQFLAGGE